MTDHEPEPDAETPAGVMALAWAVVIFCAVVAALVVGVLVWRIVSALMP